MFGLFKKNPIEKLEKKRKMLLEAARDTQRSGDLRAYARQMEEIAALEMEIETLRQS
jgi:hypothetical protein